MFDFWSLFPGGQQRFLFYILYVITWYFSSGENGKTFFSFHTAFPFSSPRSLYQILLTSPSEREKRWRWGLLLLLLPLFALHPPTIILGRLNGERGEMFLSSFSWKWASEVRAAPYTSVVRPSASRLQTTGQDEMGGDRKCRLPTPQLRSMSRVMIMGMVFLL